MPWWISVGLLLPNGRTEVIRVGSSYLDKGIWWLNRHLGADEAGLSPEDSGDVEKVTGKLRMMHYSNVPMASRQRKFASTGWLCQDCLVQMERYLCTLSHTTLSSFQKSTVMSANRMDTEVFSVRRLILPCADILFFPLEVFAFVTNLLHFLLAHCFSFVQVSI